MPRRKAMTVHTPDLMAGDRMVIGDCTEEVLRVDSVNGSGICKVFVKRTLPGMTEPVETWYYSGRNALHEISRAAGRQP
jgi:hypothetical protein